MNQYDPQKAAQVWQRVQAQPPGTSAPENFSALILAQWETTAVCRQISDTGLRSIIQTAQRHLQCLKGIHTLTAGQSPVIRTPAIPKDTASVALRKCCGRMLRCLREYEKRSDDPEYGPIFRHLALEQRESCCRLLEYIGTQEKGAK